MWAQRVIGLVNGGFAPPTRKSNRKRSHYARAPIRSRPSTTKTTLMRKVGVVLHLLALLSGGPWTSVVVAQVTVASNSTSSSSSNGTSTDTSTTTNTTRPACYTSFRDIMVDMDKKDPFSFEKYIVCPNTLVEIGTPVSLDSIDFTNGDAMLTMRQFSRVYCGEDGASSNNCTVRGGDTQVSVTHYSYESEAKKRMEVKGFTFEAAESFAIFAIFAEGDLLLEDCIFRNISQGGVLTASVASQLAPDITFRNCRFDNNMVGNIGNMFDPNGGARLTITDSVFSNNKYKSDRVRTTSAIQVPDKNTELTLQNNCFFNNDFETTALVRVEVSANLVDVKNNFGANDDDNLKCSFIYVAEGDGTCVDFDAKTCPIAGVDAPPAKPSTAADGKEDVKSGGGMTVRRPVIVIVATTTVAMVAALQHLF